MSDLCLCLNHAAVSGGMEAEKTQHEQLGRSCTIVYCTVSHSTKFQTDWVTVRPAVGHAFSQACILHTANPKVTVPTRYTFGRD